MAEKQSTEQKIEQTEKHYAKSEIKQFNKEQKRLVYKKRRISAILIIAAIIFLFVGANLFNRYQDIQKLAKEKQAALAEQTQVHRQVATLGQEVDLLKDEDYLQKLARAKYYYSLEGELVYSIPQTNKPLDQEATTTSKK